MFTLRATASRVYGLCGALRIAKFLGEARHDRQITGVC